MTPEFSTKALRRSRRRLPRSDLIILWESRRHKGKFAVRSTPGFPKHILAGNILHYGRRLPCALRLRSEAKLSVVASGEI